MFMRNGLVAVFALDSVALVHRDSKMYAYTTSANNGQEASLVQRMTAVAGDLKGLACEHAELAVLEAQQAATSFAKLMSAVVAATVLVVSAWLAIVVAAVVSATLAGMALPLTLLAAAAGNVVLAGVAVRWIRKQMQGVPFAATLRQLRHYVGNSHGAQP